MPMSLSYTYQPILPIYLIIHVPSLRTYAIITPILLIHLSSKLHNAMTDSPPCISECALSRYTHCAVAHRSRCVLHCCTQIVLHCCTQIVLHGCTQIVLHCCTQIQVQTSRASGQVPMVRVRNPWGDSHEWKGAWSDGYAPLSSTYILFT